ncbi:MAG: hypothetical protein DSM106950_26945 [Stigonema ocellatum SAG 48.90 = DSM 106950]|nr:hypothetical protein [Stigonema ocellatum SAG 48.90 = DSM 106950]
MLRRGLGVRSPFTSHQGRRLSFEGMVGSAIAPNKLSGRGLGVEGMVGSAIAPTNYPGRGLGVEGTIGSAICVHKPTAFFRRCQVLHCQNADSCVEKGAVINLNKIRKRRWSRWGNLFPAPLLQNRA